MLDVALDAMKSGDKATAETLFAELDVVHPGWQFEVPYRNRRASQATTFRSPNGVTTVHTHTREYRARQLIVTMFYLAHSEANTHRGRAIGFRALGGMFGGVKVETARIWVRRGLRDLGVVDEHGDLIPIESDFDPKEREQALLKRLERAEWRAKYDVEVDRWRETARKHRDGG